MNYLRQSAFFLKSTSALLMIAKYGYPEDFPAYFIAVPILILALMYVSHHFLLEVLPEVVARLNRENPPVRPCFLPPPKLSRLERGLITKHYDQGAEIIDITPLLKHKNRKLHIVEEDPNEPA